MVSAGVVLPKWGQGTGAALGGFCPPSNLFNPVHTRNGETDRSRFGPCGSIHMSEQQSRPRGRPQGKHVGGASADDPATGRSSSIHTATLAPVPSGAAAAGVCAEC